MKSVQGPFPSVDLEKNSELHQEEGNELILGNNRVPPGGMN